MKSFDEFWKSEAIPQIDIASKEIKEAAKDAESNADVMGVAMAKLLKRTLQAYHSWLLQNLEDR